MTKSIKQTQVRLSPQGRLLIPLEIRKILNLEPGMTLIARVEDSKLVLEKPEDIKARVLSRFQNLPEDVSLVEELIAERLEESKKKPLND